LAQAVNNNVSRNVGITGPSISGGTNQSLQIIGSANQR